MAVKVEELRIGNWLIDHQAKPYQVTVKTLVDIDSGGRIEDMGILLNPAQLSRFGFVQNEKGEWHKEDWLPYLSQRRKDHSIYQVYNVADCFVMFVHELQNLFFAITGQELTA